TGLGPFYDGLAHFFTTPEDLLPVVALSLYAGLRGPRWGRAVLFVLPPAWIAGTFAGRLFSPHWAWPVLSAALTIVLGALAAADRSLPVAAVGALGAALGLWNGAWNGIELARARASAMGNALGVACAVFAVVAILAALAASLRVPWTRIVVRVAGSWIAAAALFMLGWALRPA
ncbi:MAG TPA: HupE/UreJ family protein, partial [Thermoanaerobaculia bacterium]